MVPRELVMKRMMRLGLSTTRPKSNWHHHSLAPLYRPQIHFENTNSIRREMGSLDHGPYFLTDRIHLPVRPDREVRTDGFADGLFMTQKIKYHNSLQNTKTLTLTLIRECQHLGSGWQIDRLTSSRFDKNIFYFFLLNIWNTMIDWRFSIMDGSSGKGGR